MYTDKCTLYSKFTDAVTKNTFYFRTELSNIQWQNSRGRNVYKSGATSIDALTVYIKPANVGKTYLDPIDFAAIPSESKPDYWTMQAGDILVKGISDYEYTQGDNPLAVLKKRYSDVFTITNIDTWITSDPRMAHWEVWGK